MTYTAQALVDELSRIIAETPSVAEYPVFILDMDLEFPGLDSADGLVTDIDVDVYDQADGPVVTILSWGNKGTMLAPSTQDFTE